MRVELFRCVAAGAGAEREAGKLGVFATPHTKALVRICAALPARDADARCQARHRLACRIIAPDKLFGRLLL